MSERSSTQTNNPASTNMQYGYVSGSPYDHINLPQMPTTGDLYSYYNPNMYPAFGTFDDQNQWGSAETQGNVQPGHMPFHPSMYTPSPIDIPRSPFDYPPAHHYTHYHHPFQTSSFPPPPTTGASGFDVSWNHPNMQIPTIPIAAQQTMTPIGMGIASTKKPLIFDEQSSVGASDILAQQFHSVNIGAGSTRDEKDSFDNSNQDNPSMLSSKEQQQNYQSTSNNHSLQASRPSHAQAASSNGPKSYASVVSADTMNPHSNKSTPSISNVTARPSVQMLTHENTHSNSNFTNDANSLRSNQNNRTANNFNNTNNYNPHNRNGSAGYNPRDQKQSNSSGVNALNCTNNNNSTNPRGNNQNSNSTTFYNSATANYYNQSPYPQQQHQQNPSPSNNFTNNKRNYSYHQQNFGSSRGANSANNGNTAASQQPITPTNQEVLDALKRTHQYNPEEFNMNPKGARFFVIKSYSEDDVHRSIKYNIWCSTEHGNKRLDNAFREREGKGPIYLFFSVNASGHFCGMAEMMSPVDYEHKTDVWHASNKWHGKFEVKWIYVKDVPNQQFRNIRLENNDNKPVTNSRDTQEIPYEKGRLMLRNMHSFPHKTSIFDDFQYYESKQAEEKTKKPTNNEQINNNSARGYYNNKRPYSSNRTAMMHSEHQVQQQQTFEDIQHDEQN